MICHCFEKFEFSLFGMDPISAAVLAFLSVSKSGKDTATLVLLVFAVAVGLGFSLALGALVWQAHSAVLSVVADVAAVCVAIIIVILTFALVAAVIRYTARPCEEQPRRRTSRL